MAKTRNDAQYLALFRPYLQAGESVTHFAYGVKQPSLLLIIPLLMIGLLPGLIVQSMLTKEYLVGLSDRGRLHVLRFTGKHGVSEAKQYELGKMPPAKIGIGPIFTHIRIADPAKPFAAKFHRMGLPNNREHSQFIARALEQRALAA